MTRPTRPRERGASYTPAEDTITSTTIPPIAWGPM